MAAELPEQPEKTVTLDDAGLPEDAEAVLEETGMTEGISGVLAPITILAAVVMALLEYFLAKGTVFEAVSIFTSALCITSPLAATLGSHMPLRSANEGLNRWRANLLNEDAVEELHDTDGVLLRGSDLFPSGSITLHGIRTFEKKPIDEAILNAASVLCSVDNSLTGIFRGMITNEKNLKTVESVACEEGKGISAWVDGGRVLIGNRGLLLAHGVAVPPIEVEAGFTAEGKELLYLSNFGSLSAGFVISYHADKQLRTQLRELEKVGIALMVHTTDPNITPARVAQVYGLQEENIHMVPAALQREAEAALDGTGETAAEMVSGRHGGQSAQPAFRPAGVWPGQGHQCAAGTECAHRFCHYHAAGLFRGTEPGDLVEPGGLSAPVVYPNGAAGTGAQKVIGPAGGPLCMAAGPFWYFGNAEGRGLALRAEFAPCRGPKGCRMEPGRLKISK